MGVEELRGVGLVDEGSGGGNGVVSGIEGVNGIELGRYKFEEGLLNDSSVNRQ